MKRNLLYLAFTAILLTTTACGTLDMNRIMQGGMKTAQAMLVSDDMIKQYVSQYISSEDAKGQVLPSNNQYSIRLTRLTSGLTNVDGTPLNFKVYGANEVNAFACADGSIRVYKGLMDAMSDEEVLGVIGHEIGHIAHQDTKNAFKHALYASAFFDGLASTGSTVAALTDSQLGQLGQAIISAKYSQKQELNADDYGYSFLKSHGKNPIAMASAFKRLKALEGANASSPIDGLTQLLSTHPSLDKRIQRMQTRAASEGYK